MVAVIIVTFTHLFLFKLEDASISFLTRKILYIYNKKYYLIYLHTTYIFSPKIDSPNVS